jgi:hypothetical protein
MFLSFFHVFYLLRKEGCALRKEVENEKSQRRKKAFTVSNTTNTYHVQCIVQCHLETLYYIIHIVLGNNTLKAL